MRKFEICDDLFWRKSQFINLQGHETTLRISDSWCSRFYIMQTAAVICWKFDRINCFNFSDRKFFFSKFLQIVVPRQETFSRVSGIELQKQFWKFKVFTIENRLQKFILRPYILSWGQKCFLQAIFNGKNFEFFPKLFYHSIPETLANVSCPDIKIFRNFEILFYDCLEIGWIIEKNSS